MLRMAVGTVFVAAFSLNLSAQGGQKITDAFTAHPGNTTSVSGNQLIRASHFLTYSINTAELANRLQNVPYREVTSSAEETLLTIPHPNGTSHVYRVRKNQTLHPELAALFPEIQTFDIYGVSHPEEHGKIDVTPQGFHAMIMSPNNSTVFIDPLIHGQNDLHMVYYKKDFITDKAMSCYVDAASTIWEEDNAMEIRASYASCEMRTYRLALAATGEYTIFHGGTVALALAAQATSMNRVNGVYEKAMAITMVIIPNNNLIIYTNPATDPYTNGDAGAMLGENQTNVNAVIGAANYDIGHVYGTNSGGVAGLGVVCSNTNKARGVTGSGAPINDPFDIDYVAHEMGHQFAMNHTQNNNCNRNNATAMEPGSASTIMGYAGICAPNVQNNSDDHLHGVSLREMGLFISGAGHTCPVKTPLANAAPVINSTNANVVVPISTPFALTANATDANGDLLLYNWEQMNNNTSTQPPVATSTGGPNFRSFPYTSNPTRYFPNLTALANNGPFTWEVLPSVSRTMNFRVTVRDNHSVASCNDFANVTISTDATAGPFVLTYPSATGIVWAGGSTETVTWNVANTTNANVNCQNVSIYLSIDGGQTYPHVLAANTPNDGSHAVTVPNLPNTTSRVMVMAENGTFFDISNNNFQITGLLNNYDLSVLEPTQAVCAGQNAVYDIDNAQIGNYTDPVNMTVTGLPAGATSSFSVNPVATPGLSALTITTAGVAAGNYTVTLQGNSAAGNQSVSLALNVASGAAMPVSPISPAGGVNNVPIPTTFTWSASASAGALYDIQISTSPLMTNIIDQANNLSTTTYVSTALQSGTTYYWRVRTVTGCGASDYSSANSFVTQNCSAFSANDVPIVIPASGTPTITSTITVPTGGTITDVRIPALFGTHTWVSDLRIQLTSPSGTTLTLMDAICGDNDNFNIGFDDNATPGAIPCPPTTGNSYQPVQPLSGFNGENAQGNWVLTVQDLFNQDGGALQGWSLEICMEEIECTPPSIPVFSGNTSICSGSQTTLGIDFGDLNDATDWMWYTGSCGGTLVGTGTSITVSPTTNTTYFVRGEGGCVTTGPCLEIAVTVTTVNSAVTQTGGTLTAVQNGAGYQWLDCANGNAPISGATQQSYTPSVLSGNYAVQITSGNCVNTSDCFLVDVTSIQEQTNQGELVLFPNPTQGNFTLSWKNIDLQSIRLTDAAGRLIHLQTVSEAEKLELNISQQSNGVYFLHWTGLDTSGVLKVVKE